MSWGHIIGGAFIFAGVVVLSVALYWDMPARPVSKDDREGW